MKQYEFIAKNSCIFGQNYLLKRIGINKNAYYWYLKNIQIKQQKHIKKQKILNKISEIYHLNDGVTGYRMMTLELLNIGIKLSKNTVYKYMRELGLKSVTRRKCKYVKGHAHQIFDNLLKGDFKSLKPNEKWCIDFTYLHTKSNKMYYNCSVLDIYDRSIVASITGKNINSELAIKAVRTALSQAKKSKKIMLHSDQGSQFTSKLFVNFCKNNKIIQSMSRAGNPTDNAPMERFFNTLKTEFYYLYNFNNFETLKNAVNNYIFIRYNYTRPHTFNNGLTPHKARSLFKCA